MTEATSPPGKVLLIAMPFYSVKRPAPGISTLKAILTREGIGCDIRYLNLRFAALAGIETYEKICDYLGDDGDTLIGEWCFARPLFGRLLPDRDDDLLASGRFRQEPEYSAERFRSIRELAVPFLDACLHEIPWEEYRVVAFTSVFEQNLASLALARRVKERHPGVAIVFGGANCDGAMGVELHRQFPWVDYVCSGEADLSFPSLIRRILADAEVGDIPGIVWRDGDQSVATGPPQLVEDLDTLPPPDYDDWLAQLRQWRLPTLANLGGGLPMESSRGCWWGEKSKCTFCGLNAETIHYRRKSPDRVAAELQNLCERYMKPNGIGQVTMVDSILSMDYFEGLLPKLREMALPVGIFYETKANLSREQVRELRRAGVLWIQPGIESLSTPVLKLMRKGVTALRNIQLLRDCAEFGVHPIWNFLTGFPGEREEDYRQMIALMERVAHLPPPSGFSRFCLQRFSPYFDEAECHGILNIRPKPFYRHLYPVDDGALANIAYFFDFDYRPDVAPPDMEKPFSAAVTRWQEAHAAGAFLAAEAVGRDTLRLSDGRPGATHRQVTLEGPQRELYAACSVIRPVDDLVEMMRKRFPSVAIRERDVREFLDDMVALGLMAGEEERYLSLAVPVHDSNKTTSHSRSIS